jgi:hypothetical protein
MALAVVAALGGCSSESGGGDSGVPDGGVPDGGPKGCEWLSDCPNGDCVSGNCVKTDKCRCDGQAERCYMVYVDGKPVTRPMHICYGKRWVGICQTDLDCPAAGYCHNGVCEQYTFKVDVPEPDKGGTKGVLKAGFGEVPVDFPVGVSMAGYGGRAGPTTPYNGSLGGSTGFYDRPSVKAIAIDNGAEQIIFLRHANSWSTDYMNTMIAKKLEATTGKNYLNKIIASNGHSHSYPARFWTAAYGTGLGVAGSDDFMWEIFDRLTTSYAKAIELAVKNLEDAKVAYAFDSNFDPKDAVTSARASETFGAGNKDKDFLVMRFESVKTGRPIAVMMRYGTHGTIMRTTLMTGDAPAGAEYITEQYFEQDLGYHVPVMFMNGNGGNARPAGGGNDLTGQGLHGGLQSVQGCGAALYPMLKAKFDEAGTKFMTTTPEMKVVSTFIPVSRNTLKYGDDEFYADDGSGVKSPYWNGAMLCASEYWEERDPPVKWIDGFLNCLIQVDMFNDGSPFPEINKLRTTSARIGDLVLVTLPGETTNPLGLNVRNAVRTATGLSDVFTIGYSQDHQFYLLTSEDWMKGSYEGSMDIWGWKFGDHVAKYAIDNASQLKDISKAKDATDNMKYSWYEYMPKTMVTPVASKVAPAFFESPAASYKKMDIAQFKWHGGHPGAGAPRVFLERQDTGTWKTVTLGEGGPDYDDLRFHMVVQYLGNYYDSGDVNHDWQAQWAEMPAFKAGTYRFRVDGNTWDAALVKPSAYSITSSPFELKNIEVVVPSEKVVANGAKNAISMNVYYPAPPQGFDPILDSSIFWRLNSRYTPQTMGAILDREKQVDVTVKCGVDTLFAGKADVKLSDAPETRKDVNGTNYSVYYTYVTVAVDAGKSCEYDITVTDQWGNLGNVKKTF